jgi:hypothetical protein
VDIGPFCRCSGRNEYDGDSGVMHSSPSGEAVKKVCLHSMSVSWQCAFGGSFLAAFGLHRHEIIVERK